MKKTLLVFLSGVLFGLNTNAQVTVPEPEFSEETLLLTSDSDGVILKRENGYVKAKAGASLYLTGIGKVKSRLTVDGIRSINKTKANGNVRLIIKAKDNNTDPNSFINVFKFEIYKNERRYQLSEVGTLSAAKTNNLASIEYKAKKYGESSYFIQLENLESGEYGIIIGDPNSENTKNGMKVTTFTVVDSAISTQQSESDADLPRRATILKKNSLVMDVIVQSVDNDKIVYKKARKPNGESYTISRSEVERIDYK